MNLFLKTLILVLFFSCEKDKSETPQAPVKPYDNALAATWKLISVTSNSGAITTNPTDKEILTTFQKDTNTLTFENAGSMGSGKYTLLSSNRLNIAAQRADRGGWPNGPWLDLYLENINKANSYQVIDNQLKITTSEGSKIQFSKL
jgi:hypothetical protein